MELLVGPFTLHYGLLIGCVVYVTDDTIIILRSLGVGFIVLIVVIITVAVVVSRKRNRFVLFTIRDDSDTQINVFE